MAISRLKPGYQVRVSYKEGGKCRTKNVNGMKTKAEAKVIEADLQITFA